VSIRGILQQDPLPPTTQLEMHLTGMCIHVWDKPYGELCGSAWQTVIDSYNESQQMPSQFANNWANSMQPREVLYNICIKRGKDKET
jgi:hypothetical protein